MVGGIDAVSAVVKDGRRAESVQHRHIRRRGLTDESELASCHRQRGEIVPCHGDSTSEGFAGRLLVTKDQSGLGFGRGEPIVVRLTVAFGVDQTARLLGKLASPLEITGQQTQRGRVDPRVEPSVSLGNSFVQISSPTEQRRAIVTMGCQCVLLGESSHQGRSVLAKRDRDVGGDVDPRQ